MVVTGMDAMWEAASLLSRGVKAEIDSKFGDFTGILKPWEWMDM
jgi:hypothetical protein